jgi:Mg2+ and Co2+ transporter CorA
MEKQHLREKLAELHAALQDASSLDEESREALREVMDDIRGALERGHKHESLVERLREAVDRFEGTHPALTEAAGRVIDALSNLGI